MKTTLINCLFCSKEKNVLTKEIRKGKGKFCSLSCACSYNARHKTEPENNEKCAWCQKRIFISGGRRRRCKSGLFFCSRKHKELAQSINGISKILPNHYGTATGDDSYRKIAYNAFPIECNRCGYKENKLGLVVHHIDRNRKNSAISNLEILCGTCHLIEHRTN